MVCVVLIKVFVFLLKICEAGLIFGYFIENFNDKAGSLKYDNSIIYQKNPVKLTI